MTVTESAVALAERICNGTYRTVKRLYLGARFGGRVRLGDVCFRRPFFCRVGPRGQITVGGGTFINYSAKVIAHESIIIGSKCLIGPNVGIYDFDHRHELDGTNYGSQGMLTEPVTIGDNVWIGANSVILKGTTIGDNTIIASGAVVSGNIPPNCLVYERRDRVVRLRESQINQGISR